MKSVINDSVYGEIVYEESFWTGKKKLFINGKELKKEGKATYLLELDGKVTTFELKGSFLTGAKLIEGENSISVINSFKWYEIAISAFMFAFIVIWGNVADLCEIIPLVGGAIGGGIAGLMAFVNALAMKSFKKPWKKILIAVAVFAATFIVCLLIGLLILEILD